MNRIIIFLFLLAAFGSCSRNKPSRPDNSLDTGRAFIRASLDGDFKTAGELLIPDSANRELFSSYQHYYERLPEASRENYRKASYEINKISETDDSTVIFNYSNSFMKEPMEIKLVRRTGIWMVDFEHMYSPEATGK